MGRNLFLIIDSGGVVGVFSGEAIARKHAGELSAVPGWGGAIVPFVASSVGDADTEVHFLFPAGSILVPMAVGSRAAMAKQCASLARIGITDDGSSEYYRGTIDTVLPAARARIEPPNFGPEALSAFTKMMLGDAGRGAGHDAGDKMTIAHLLDYSDASLASAPAEALVSAPASPAGEGAASAPASPVGEDGVGVTTVSSGDEDLVVVSCDKPGAAGDKPGAAGDKPGAAGDKPRCRSFGA
jgi:hypothetical protein